MAQPENQTPTPAEARAARVYHARCRTRFRLACLGFALAFVLIGGRLVSLGLAGSGPGRGGAYDISTTIHRPDILDRNGQLLATDIRGATLFADPKRILDADEVVNGVASVLPDINRAKLRKQLAGSGRFVRIARELAPSQQQRVHDLGLPGLGFIQEYRRFYPVGPTASHVVGLVDVDNRGLGGIEKFIDNNPQLTMMNPQTESGGETVAVSLDVGAQHVLREELANAMTLYEAKAASGIVMDVRTGEVVALASLPDFNPHRREEALDKNRINRVGFGVYELGSVFKAITVAGILDSGLANVNSVYDATSPIYFGRFSISDFHGKRRPLTVTEAFIYSSNIASAKMAMHMGVPAHQAFLKKLGLLDPVVTELGPSAAPIVPKHWKKLNTMTIAFGHGLSVTPLQLAAATVPLMNGGLAIPPTFLPRTREEALAVSKRVVSPETSAAMVKLMRENVLRGSGKRANAEGYRVGGKTGTAEKVVNGRYARHSLLNSFLSVFPTDDPQYVVLVTLDEPQRVEATNWNSTAGVNAAPTVGKIVARIAPILGVQPRLDETASRFDAKTSATY
ncbi:peptidoglycan D,D-transpeptidase FtsI family protein [Methyloceanibacter caenitepidi]|uniref:Cell division protein FtsI [Peptidoglycan synthetase] n=1 Tax=Methyloceanibacter caenitepidi TaxID=1384459 RepID=A0A0A8K2M2_9HYPH|nr:penicillin-binding protein 2 [Methyloceanibacter caenitepidi]BAQ17026.1 cell division protein FtsI [Peptidoglycan synthetase] [Methyloceanibacter caenitepidi]